MFRRSKRDKERKGSFFTSDEEGEKEKNGSLKRHSKLFIFGRRDKKKHENLQDQDSPDTDGIRVEESFGNTVTQRHFVRAPHQIMKPVVEETNNDTRKQNSSVNSHQRQVSNSGSLSLDFGTDSSLTFQSFAADVLRATEEKLKGVNLKLPEVKTEPNSNSTREVTVTKKQDGDYGIALRRSTVKKDGDKVVHFVEPTNDNTSLGLLPGDRLVSVDGQNVENCSREEIIEKVASAGNSVTLKVAPVPEFAELSSRTAAVHAHSPKLGRVASLARSGSSLAKIKKNKAESETVNESSWRDSEKVWLVHQGGYSAGLLYKQKNADGETYSCKVKLDHGGEVVEVEEDAVEKANPLQFDKVEDLCTLRYLNESGCLHTLRQRYAGSLTYTYAGNKLVAIRPKDKLGIYTEKVMWMFKGCKREDMPPHIYATAQTCYRTMFSANINQSIVLQGCAGSGKTYNLHQLIKYFTTVTKSAESKATAMSMEAALSLIGSFTQARTKLSHNASFGRFLYTLDFDTSGLVIGASIQNFFLDKARVSRMVPNESSYQIFYELLDGCDKKLKQDLFLDSLPREGNFLFDFEEKFSDKDTHLQNWSRLQTAFQQLNISPDEVKGIISPIAAILHLGAAGVATTPGSKPYFNNPTFAQKAASILGTTEENLSRIIFTSSVQMASRSRSGSTISRSNSTASRSSVTFNKSDESGQRVGDVVSPTMSLLSFETMYDNCLISLEAFTAGLYVEAFTALMRLINRAINTAARVSSVVNMYDGPGFQNKLLIGKSGTFEDLCSNYCCEKLQWLMHYCTFTSQIERYNRENIDCNYSYEITTSPDMTITVIDKLTVDRRISHGDISDAKGLFWMIEEEAVRSNPSEIALVEKIRTQHTVNRGTSIVTTDANLPEMFMISHLQNTCSVKYNVNGWLRRVREHPAVKMAYSVLSDSSKSHVTELYAGHQSGTFQAEGSSHTRGNRRRTHGHTALSSVRRNSVSMQLKTQMERILEILDRTTVHFVYCFLSEPLDGCLNPVKQSSKREKSSAPVFDVPFLRQQLKSAHLLESMRIRRQGYPDHMNFSEFLRRFSILLPKENEEKQTILDEKQTVSTMIEKLDLEDRSYKLGISQIFFRSGVLPQLEDTRDEKLSESVTEFQALCRGVLARRNLKKLKLQLMAIRCVQKNVRKFLLVRNWPWWRVYTKVLPLLDVHRTEQELKSKTSEVGTLHNKINKLTSEKNDLTDENARLKKKVQEFSSQLSEVHSSASGAGELLDHETAERERLEEDLEIAKMETERIQRQYDQLQTEYCDMKVHSISNGGFSYERGVDAEELEENDNVWRQKYKALSRELENTRRNLTDQAEEEIQELMNLKRSGEKALAEERAESDEARRQLANTKRKLNKVNAEMDDLKLLLEGLQGRNSNVEKKQRKFDHEMQNLQEAVEQERALREAAQRERDKNNSEKLALQNSITSYEEEIIQLKRKIDRLNEEIDDYVSSGKTDAELVAVKRIQRELETKVQDQEEELDEQAGQIQQLEQVKLKLEMASQRDRHQFQRDLDTKDEDIEQMRTDHQRKMRALEEQLDEEMKRKDDVNKAKRELERQVYELRSSTDDVDRSMERRLKKELKKLRILYKDAKTALENQAARSGDSSELKALRNQLEDAEFAKHMAIKAKAQIETDLEELTAQNENLSNARETIEEKCLILSRENAEHLTRLDEIEDEVEDMIRKNKQLISQVSEAQGAVSDAREKYRSIEDEKDVLSQKVDMLTQKLESQQKNMIERTEFERLEFRLRDIESKFETETASKIKLEHQVNRLKGQLERVSDERTDLQNNHSRILQTSSRFERQVKEYRDELESVKGLESEHKRRKEEAENRLQNMEEELSLKKTELSLAEKRIRDLQESLEQEMAASSDEDITLDDVYGSDDSLTSPANVRRSSSRRNRSFKFSSSSFETSLTSPSYRPRKNEDSYRPSNGILGRTSSTSRPTS